MEGTLLIFGSFHLNIITNMTFEHHHHNITNISITLTNVTTIIIITSKTLSTIEEGEEYYEKVKINSMEKLEIDSWAQKKQYQAVCKVSGFSTHQLALKSNI